MHSIKQFFWFCSGADPLILKRCPTDHQKYLGIGAAIFFTGILAFLAATYAIWTVFGSWLASVALGLVWGLMIFNLDRYIVSSMKTRGSFFKDFAVALPRIVLAIILALVIAKPLELKIFGTEINAELVLMEQERIKDQEDQVKLRYEDDLEKLDSQIAGLKSEIENLRVRRDAAALTAVQEADGTGGSMNRNLGPIYRAKKADADKLQQEFGELLATNNTSILAKEDAISQLESQKSENLGSLKRASLTGFAARLDALHRLGLKSKAIWMANLFIIFLFIVIECAPIFVKLISSRSPYDFVLHKHEHQYAMNHKQSTVLLTNAVQNKIGMDTEVGTYRTQKAILAEKQLLEHYLKEEVERLKRKPVTWPEIVKGLFSS